MSQKVPDEDIRDFIEKFSELPDSQLHPSLAEECERFLDGKSSFEDPVLFLADLRDQAVHCGGASGAVMNFFRMLIEENGHPWEHMRERLENHPDSHRSQLDDLDGV